MSKYFVLAGTSTSLHSLASNSASSRAPFPSPPSNSHYQAFSKHCLLLLLSSEANHSLPECDPEVVRRARKEGGRAAMRTMQCRPTKRRRRSKTFRNLPTRHSKTFESHVSPSSNPGGLAVGRLAIVGLRLYPSWDGLRQTRACLSEGVGRRVAIAHRRSRTGQRADRVRDGRRELYMPYAVTPVGCSACVHVI